MLIFLLLLIAAASMLALRKWRRTSRAIFVVALVVSFAVGCGPVPSFLLRELQDPYSGNSVEWGQRNAIVLLGLGTEQPAGVQELEVGSFAYGRVLMSLQLYNACRLGNRHCTILVSGGDAQGHSRSEASVYAERLRQLGVGDDDLVVEEKSKNTWQNAQFSAPLLHTLAPDRVILVSSGIHLRRSVLYFRHFGLVGVPVRADYLSTIPSLMPLAYNFMAMDLAIHEYLGIARYRLYNALGWNVAPTLPKTE